ncbi:Cyclin-dependent kinase 2 [Entamoeba marina]
MPCSSLREITALSDLKHKNIVNLLDIITTENSLYLVFEFCDNDLQKFIKNTPSSIPIPTIQDILNQVIQALSYCHSHRIYHRDIKPGNILMNNNGEIKLGDFGLSRAFRCPSKHFTPEVITLWYRAPEILLGSPSYTSAVDMWSVGAIFGEMIIKTPLFTGSTESDQLKKIYELLGTPNNRDWPEITQFKNYVSTQTCVGKDFTTLFGRVGRNGIDLLKNLLVYNPQKRISAVNALDHKFFLSH